MSTNSRVPSFAASPLARPTSTTALPMQLEDVVEFYDDRFSVGFSEQEKEDLVAFLMAL